MVVGEFRGGPVTEVRGQVAGKAIHQRCHELDLGLPVHGVQGILQNAIDVLGLAMLFPTGPESIAINV
jgi:hypothetical protein